MKRVGIIALGALALVVSACTSIPPGATTISAANIKSELSGRTWLWDVGGPGAGMYFAPDGKAHIYWEGELHKTTWSTRDGAFCYRGPSNDRCWAVYEKDGVRYRLSLWQPEYSEPYRWNPTNAPDVKSGRRIG